MGNLWRVSFAVGLTLQGQDIEIEVKPISVSVKER